MRQLTLTARAEGPTGFAARSLRAFKCKIQALEIITKHIMLAGSVAARSAARSGCAVPLMGALPLPVTAWTALKAVTARTALNAVTARTGIADRKRFDPVMRDRMSGNGLESGRRIGRCRGLYLQCGSA